MYTGMRSKEILMRLKDDYIKLSAEDRMHGVDIPIVGVTGGIAGGKSSFCGHIKNHNILVISADELIKGIYSKDSSKDFVAKEFPDCLEGDYINFASLRQLAFSDIMVRGKLESFLYKHMPSEFISRINAYNSPEVVVYDVPLLFEKRLDSMVDMSVCVYCPRVTLMERLQIRDNISDQLANKMLDQQWNIEKKRKNADIVIENTGSPSELEGKAKQFVSEYFC